MTRISLPVVKQSLTQECIEHIIEMIDCAGESIQEEFDKGANPRTACFASVADVIDTYR